jgi:hypothetical protein
MREEERARTRWANIVAVDRLVGVERVAIGWWAGRREGCVVAAGGVRYEVRST